MIKDLDIAHIEAVLKLGKIQTIEEIRQRENLWLENRKMAKTQARREIKDIEKKESRKFNEFEKVNYINKAVSLADRNWRIKIINLANEL